MLGVVRNGLLVDVVGLGLALAAVMLIVLAAFLTTRSLKS
jgi:hypothetical protein